MSERPPNTYLTLTDQDYHQYWYIFATIVHIFVWPATRIHVEHQSIFYGLIDIRVSKDFSRLLSED